MPYAVELDLDPASAAIAAAAMRSLQAYPCVETPFSIGMVPHLTLAVWAVIDPVDIMPRLDAFARMAPPALLLSSLGVFGGARAVLFLAPTPTVPLLHYHHAFHHAFADLDRYSWPHYRPDCWVPHVTLAEYIAPTAIGPALAAIAPGWTACEAHAAALGLIRFRPVERLHEIRFPVEG